MATTRPVYVNSLLPISSIVHTSLPDTVVVLIVLILQGVHENVVVIKNFFFLENIQYYAFLPDQRCSSIGRYRRNRLPIDHKANRGKVEDCEKITKHFLKRPVPHPSPTTKGADTSDF